MHTTRRAVFALALCLAPAAHADDAAIAALVERMEAAVLAGNAEAYLACIDTTEPEWAREQKNWAADLDGHTPEAFDIELTSDPAGDATLDGGLTAGIRMSWRLPEGRDRAVEFAARFTPADAGEWLYAGEAWRMVVSSDGENVVLYLDEDLGEIARRVIQEMPAIRDHVDEGFGTRLDHPQVVKIYAEMAHLQQSIYLSYVDPLGGWNEPGEAMKIMASPRSNPRMIRNLLAHEYGHVATFTYHPEASDNLPWWTAEGAAELAAERYAGRGGRERVDEVVRAWAKAGSLAEWDQLADFRETPLPMHRYVYTQGHQFLGYLSERFGRDARNQWLRRLAEGAGADGATREAFGIGFAELDRQWRDSLEPSPAPSEDD